MKRIYVTILVLCAPLLFSISAQAQHSGPYVGAFFGGNALMKAKSSSLGVDSAFEFKPAPTGSAVLGWDLEPGNPLGEGRLELEYSRRSNPLDKVNFSGWSAAGGGKMTADSLLFNCIGVFRDETTWSPYLGLGLGAAQLKADNLTVTGKLLSNDSAVVFAYQVQTGFDIELSKYFSLDLGYRYFSTARPTFAEANGRKFTMDYVNHSAVLGLRVGF